MLDLQAIQYGEDLEPKEPKDAGDEEEDGGAGMGGSMADEDGGE